MIQLLCEQLHRRNFTTIESVVNQGHFRFAVTPRPRATALPVYAVSPGELSWLLFMSCRNAPPVIVFSPGYLFPMDGEPRGINYWPNLQKLRYDSFLQDG